MGPYHTIQWKNMQRVNDKYANILDSLEYSACANNVYQAPLQKWSGYEANVFSFIPFDFHTVYHIIMLYIEVNVRLCVLCV